MESVVHRVDGLSAPIEILVDPWGVPHIYAQELYDVFFGQGFNAARDRLWQLDIWKRRGDGTLAEVFGPAYAEKDRAARLFLFRGDMRGDTRGDMRAEWSAYGSDTKRIVRAFVAGVNAYIEVCRKDPALLPFEFRELDYEPALWTPETVVCIRSHGLLWNITNEVARAEFVRDHGTRALEYREILEPPHELKEPQGLDLSLLPDDVLRVYHLAVDPATFERAADGQLTPVGEAAGTGQAGRQGSNNWVISGQKSASGRPILANDPHRAITLPSLRYIAHLCAPGLDVIGAGEPSLPGISLGHNGSIAFGFTIFSIDQEDLYIYKTRETAPDEYWYADGWEAMKIVNEEIPVRGGAPIQATLKFTRHGPVIYEDVEAHCAIAVRAAWLEPGMAPYLGSIDLMRAKNWDEFLAESDRWGVPGENLIYADPAGNIGWKAAGITPIRPNWDGLLPVPGDGRYEWSGFRATAELPALRNPERGWIATANEMNLPEGYPHAIGFEWTQPYRYQRIREVLQQERRFSLQDMLKLQGDCVSVSARRVCAQLAELKTSDPLLQRALDLLSEWEGKVEAPSAAAALYELWFHRHLVREVMENWIEDESLRAAATDPDSLHDVFEGSSVEVVIRRLEDPDAWHGRDPRAARDAALLASLSAAIEELTQLLGEDWQAWSWGRLHTAHLVHPLSGIVAGEERERLDVGPAPRGGSGGTVNSTGYEPGDFVQQYGASFRMVIDVGGWDNSLAVNTPGQSGNPESPHYRDLFDRWIEDQAFPLLYSRERVEQVAELRIVLEPAEPEAEPASTS